MKTDIQIDHAIVLLLARSQDLPRALEIVINAYPEEHREQLAFDYGVAIQAYLHTDSSKPVVVQISQPIGKYEQSDFVEQADTAKLQLLKCPNDGHMHFRHAGYVMPMMPYIDKQEGKVSIDAVQVMVCTKCRYSYIARDGKLHDVTSIIDLEAWEKLEVSAHKATGPGGSNC
jgi:hypothetical protein